MPCDMHRCSVTTTLLAVPQRVTHPGSQVRAHAVGQTGAVPVGETDDRPWGSYIVLDDEPDHKVKRITVRPGERLSYQLHERRSEHWFVVSGNGVAVLDGVEHDIGAGEAIDVPCRTAHRIENTGREALVFIEVQHGDYFGEDDIARLQDDYGRAGSSG